MRFMQLKCSNCNAQLELDTDHLQAYCPYCGQRLAVDIEDLSDVLVEKEKTKQTRERTKRTQIQIDYNDRKEKRSSQQLRKMFLVELAVLAAVCLYWPISRAVRSANGEMHPPISSSEACGQDYEYISKVFQEAGFTNIESVATDHTVSEDMIEDGTVVAIAINGDTDFSSLTWASEDALIRITYYAPGTE